MAVFAAYEFLVYVIPGALLLIILMVMFPKVRAFFGTERMDVGGFGVFLIIAFGFGLTLNVIGIATIEKEMIAKGKAFEAQTLMTKDLAIVLPEVRERFFKVARLHFPELATKIADCGMQAKKAAEPFAKGTEQFNKATADVWSRHACLEAARNLVRRVHTKINLDRLSDRLEIYGTHYALSLTVTIALFAVLLVVAAVFIFQALTRGHLYYWKMLKIPMPFQIAILIAIAVAIDFGVARMATFDRLFAQELINAFAFSRQAIED